MLAALGTPETYASHYLSSSLYLLIVVLAAGYGIVLLVGNALDRVTVPSASRQASGIMLLIAPSRWFWLPAVYALALIVVLMITLTQQGGVGQMMYRSF